jgi:hypothetical protein
MSFRQIDRTTYQRARSYFNRLAGKPCLRLAASLVLAAALIAAPIACPVQASGSQRVVKTTQNVLAHHWELLNWSTHTIECDFYVKNDGLPTLVDVKNNCEDDVYLAWMNTPACTTLSGNDGSTCSGLFLRDLGVGMAAISMTEEFPLPSVKVTPTNCQPWSWCDDIPTLSFTGTEPMQGQSINAIHLRMNNQERRCDAASCELRLPITGDMWIQIEYWAVSTYGDESPHQVLPMRIRYPLNPTHRYRLELLGDAWGKFAPPGAVRWRLFPSANNPAALLVEQPGLPSDLSTQNTYLLLAGSLIQDGKVDASQCPGGGLLLNGTANECGEKAARALVILWQNHYDTQILNAALVNEVPARLLKAVIARETQFWPRADTPYELGLGRVTANGADLLLNWNVDFFVSLCTNMYSRSECAAGFSSLTNQQKIILRAKTLAAVGTSDEINLIAAILRASSAQVVQLIKNVTGNDVASVVPTLEDMWAMSIGNYHSGSGCIGFALESQAPHDTIAWADVANNLPAGCEAGKSYVDEVLNLAK